MSKHNEPDVDRDHEAAAGAMSVGRPARYEEAVLEQIARENPGVSLGQLSVIATGRNSGSMRERFKGIRARLGILKSGKEPAGGIAAALNEMVSAFEGMARGIAGDAAPGVTVTAAGVEWGQDETARWEKSEGRSSLFVRPREVASQAGIEAICSAALDALTDAAPVIPEARPLGDGLLVIGLSDLHLSKLAHVSTTGESWNRAVAAEAAMKSVATLLHRARGRFSRIVITCGNDLLHAEDGRNTTGGTPQDTGDLYHVAAEAAIGLMVKIVTLCAGYAPTDVLVIPGNHARRGDWWIGRVIAAAFSNTPHVRVDHTPRDRMYYRWKGLLLGFTHGDGIKPAALPQLMATEAAQDWAGADQREWLIGHTHAGRSLTYKTVRNTEELPGVTVTTMPAMCAADVWHSGAGWTGTRRLTQAYIYDGTGARDVMEYVNHTHGQASHGHVIRGDMQ